MTYQSIEIVEFGNAEVPIESGGEPIVDEYGNKRTYPDVAIYEEYRHECDWGLR